MYEWDDFLQASIQSGGNLLGQSRVFGKAKRGKNPTDSQRALAAGDCNTQTCFLISHLVFLKEALEVFVWDC